MKLLFWWCWLNCSWLLLCTITVSVVLTTGIDLIWHHSFKRNIKFRDNLKVLLMAAILDQWYFSIEISFLIFWITSKYYFSILLFLYFNSWWFFAFFNVLFFWVKMFSSPNIFQCSFSYYYFFNFSFSFSYFSPCDLHMVTLLYLEWNCFFWKTLCEWTSFNNISLRISLFN